MHEPECTCQYGIRTPVWYVSVKYCPAHAESYDPANAPGWAATDCGPGGLEVAHDKAAKTASLLPPAVDEDDAYEISDPKHPRFHEVMAEVWDNREKIQ